MLKFLFLALIGLSLAGGGVIGVMAGTGNLDLPDWGGHHMRMGGDDEGRGGHHMGWSGDDEGRGCGQYEDEEDRHCGSADGENGTAEECAEEPFEWCEEYDGGEEAKE